MSGPQYLIGTIPPGSTVQRTETGIEVCEPDGNMREFQISMEGSRIMVREIRVQMAPDFSLSVATSKRPAK
jgi:hypothetical protein